MPQPPLTPPAPLPRRGVREASRGLTMVELMVTVAIAAILGTLAAPAFNDFLVRNRSSAMANEFTSSVLRARNEAVSRNTCVVICRSTTQGDALPSCNTSAEDWRVGWIVFTDPTCAAVNAPADATSMVSVSGPFDANFSFLKRGADTTRVMFSASGNARAADAGRFDLRYATSERSSNRSICLNPLGRTRVVAWQNNTSAICPSS
jgi:type IV fimbrial biogenesis protein FimT